MCAGWDGYGRDTAAVAAETERRHLGAVAMLRDSVDVLVRGMELAPPQELDPARLVQMGFVSQSLNALYLAIRAALMGLHFQAMGLLRFVFESFAAYWYLDNHPEEAVRWLGDAPNQRPPTIETMIKGMAHPDDEARKVVSSHRTMLHRFAHADPYAVRYLFTETDGHMVVRWGATYDAELFEVSCCNIAAWLGQMVEAVGQAVPLDNEWHEARVAAQNRLFAYIDDSSQRKGKGKPEASE